MGAFFVYIVKSAVCLAVFYLFYRLLLSRETFHRFNRIALLGILILSCAIPFVEVTMKEPMEVSQQLLTWEELLLMASLNRTATIETAPESVITWREALLMVYLLGIVFFFLRNVWSLTRMLRLIKGSTLVRQENGITLITHQKEIAPFSWMKFVVISEKDLKENGEEILTHEYAHIRKRHSIDLLIADICIFFQWFNPASWLLKQELQNIHEFEADESVIAQGIDAKKYQLLLIKKAVGTRLYSMANSFNHSSLKKRITMMLKKKSNPWARLKYLYVLPLAAIAVAAFARPEISSELDEISAVKVNDLTAIMKTEEVKSPEKHPAKEIKVQGQVLEKSTNAPVVGATTESDKDILYLSSSLYQHPTMRRVYYSGYISVNTYDKRLPALKQPPLVRENRLYQADWLLRFYQFKVEEIVDDSYPDLDLEIDPKLGWALRHPEQFPIDINQADYEMILRVPGIGIKSARQIIASRRFSKLGFYELKKIGVVMKKAQYFITCNELPTRTVNELTPTGVRRLLVPKPKKKVDERQLILNFTDNE